MLPWPLTWPALLLSARKNWPTKTRPVPLLPGLPRPRPRSGATCAYWPTCSPHRSPVLPLDARRPMMSTGAGSLRLAGEAPTHLRWVPMRQPPGSGRRSRTAAVAAPRTPRSCSRELFLEALAPRWVTQLPAEFPLDLGVGKAAPLGHHAHHHLAGQQPGQPSPAWPRSLSSPSPGGHGPPAAAPGAARTACHETRTIITFLISRN
jgi:hypothetical protein